MTGGVLSHSFEYTPPNHNLQLCEAAAYLAKADDFHGQGTVRVKEPSNNGEPPKTREIGMVGYRQFRMITVSPSRGSLTVWTRAPEYEPGLRVAFDSFLSKKALHVALR
jgi:hypothetical protein